MNPIKAIFSPSTSLDGKLNWQDFWKTLYVILGPAIALVTDAVIAWTQSPAGTPLHIDWQTIGKVSVGLIVLYGTKQLKTPPAQS